MRIEPRKLESGQTLHFEEEVGNGVFVSVITQLSGRPEISIHDDKGVAPIWGNGIHLEDCLSRATMLVGFFKKAGERT